MREITIGMAAHVDAGKTTLTEALLYASGMIRSFGRVDHGDTHLDTDDIERNRGITVFSKQAVLQYKDTRYSLLDTPGHVDLTAETERVFPVLDYAVLVINASDPVQAHTITIWKLLEHYNIPTFLFVTKTDLPNCGESELTQILRSKLSPGCTSFSSSNVMDEIAVLDENLLEQYLENGTITDTNIQSLIHARKLFPCCFGSALKQTGITEFLDVLYRYTVPQTDKASFGAKVYKVIHDGQNNRYSFLKVSGGILKIRECVTYCNRSGEEITEKITDIRIYSGDKFTQIKEATCGLVCAVSGLSQTYSGQGLGCEKNADSPIMEPYMQFSVIPTDGTDAKVLFQKLRLLNEENPEMQLQWDSKNQVVQLRLMGNIQTDVVCALIQRKLAISVQISEGKILYRETILNEVEGIGHYEPLRHFAEVHLVLRPLPRGEGLRFTSACSQDILGMNWQRLILTHLAEKQHLGVLTGAPITDMEIILKSGKDHIKHTEGGDFRQATYRAVRQGLMQANSILLEPYCSFTLDLPQEQLGHAIQDLQKYRAEFGQPVIQEDGTACMRGTAPAATLQTYTEELRNYTHGKGRFSCTFSHYDRCHNESEVVAAAGYHPESDLENSPDSVFCSHGAGFPVKWNEVSKYMTLPSILQPSKPVISPARMKARISEEELEHILEREFGPISRRKYTPAREIIQKERLYSTATGQRFLMIDGYNLLFAIPGLETLAQEDLSHARDMLLDIICNYSGYDGSKTMVVFDAYRVKESRGLQEEYKNISVVYTKEGETADTAIERFCHDLGKNDTVRVVTSDALIQLSVFRAGIRRVSSREFAEELKRIGRELRKLET